MIIKNGFNDLPVESYAGVRESLKKALNLLDEQEEELKLCCICSLNRKNTVITCGHVFCESRISEWTKEHKLCPECQKPIEGSPIRLYY